MTADVVICPTCNELATIVDMTPAPRFAWCDKCRALHSPTGPDPTVPTKKPPRKKSKTRKPKET